MRDLIAKKCCYQRVTRSSTTSASRDNRSRIVFTILWYQHVSHYCVSLRLIMILANNQLRHIFVRDTHLLYALLYASLFLSISFSRLSQYLFLCIFLSLRTLPDNGSRSRYCIINDLITQLWICAGNERFSAEYPRGDENSKESCHSDWEYDDHYR